ncbi:MAG TPA: hypothetical protein VF597_02600 [Candidatus Saccharimonadales bacterium]|jgi:hypothetical protein
MKTAYAIPAVIFDKLNALVENPDMITNDAYSPDAVNYPSGRITFVEQQLRYLRAHKNVDPFQYVSNLELMIKKRS